MSKKKYNKNKKAKNKRFNKVLWQKIAFTAIILVEYIIGRSIPVYGVDRAAYQDTALTMENILTQSIGGDVYNTSIFSLGVTPYIMSTMLMQMVMVMMKSDKKGTTSPKTTNRISLVLMFAFATIMSINNVSKLTFLADMRGHILTYILAFVELIVGSFTILWLIERNKKFGIGGQTAIIIVNITDSLASTIKGHELNELYIPFAISFVLMIVFLLMDYAEKRVPVQRISIHNIYSDKNYLAIKLNPIGVMPIMFSTAFFMIPQLLLFALQLAFPEMDEWKDLQAKMVLTDPVGIAVYIVILYLLTVGFSMLFINPSDLTENFLKSGDSIINMHAGKETKRFLNRLVLKQSIISATVMSFCIAIPLILQLSGTIESSLVMLPTTVMMLTGVWSNLFLEIDAVRNLNDYQTFL